MMFKECAVRDYYEVKVGCTVWGVSFRRSVCFRRVSVWGVVESYF